MTDPHHISVQDAAVLTQRWRSSDPKPTFNGARFDRIAFDNLLAVPNCAGIRIYMGLHLQSEVKPGEPLWTYVMIATDPDGNDIIPTTGAAGNAGAVRAADDDSDGDPEQNPYPCPPYCGIDDPLNSPP
jgi:hypothetical protein